MTISSTLLILKNLQMSVDQVGQLLFLLMAHQASILCLNLHFT